VLGAESLRAARALHRRHVLRQRERFAVHREQRVRARIGLRRRPLQLSPVPAILSLIAIGCVQLLGGDEDARFDTDNLCSGVAVRAE
jgi:hypothetical protein